MVDLAKPEPPGKREPLDGGTLFLPAKMKLKSHVPLVVFFHAGAWLPEVAASKTKTAVITMQLGSGAGAYAKACADSLRFAQPRLAGVTRRRT